MTGFDGSVTTYGYDFSGQFRSARQPDKGQLVSYTYDTAGKLLNRQTYDALHRLVSVSMADIGQGAQSIGYQYDGRCPRQAVLRRARLV